MAEAEQVDAPSATLPQTAPIPESQTISLPLLLGNSSPRLDDHQPLPSANTSQHQVPERVSPENSVPEHSDDEVEFVFCVPRRRKKKRRRLEIPSHKTHIDSARSITSAGVAVTHPLKENSIAEMLPPLAPGTEPDDMNLARCQPVHSLQPPTTLESFLQPLNSLQSETSESPASHVSQTIPFKIPPPWYAKSMPPPPSPTSPYYYSKSNIFTLPDQDYAKKRKYEEDSHQYSNYVSPYKVSSTSMYQPRPKALPSHSEISPIGGNTGFVDFLEDPNVPTTFGGVPPPLPPHRPIIPGWQDFSWKSSDYLPPRHLPSVDVRTRTFPDVNNDPEWHRKYHNGTGESRCFNPPQIPIRDSRSERFAYEMVSPKTIPLEIQTISAPYSSVQKEPVSKPSPIPEELPTCATSIHPAQSFSVVSLKHATHPQPTPEVVAARNISPSPPPRQQVTAADIRRRPSLYKVPAWPHSVESNQATSSNASGSGPNQILHAGSDTSRTLQCHIPQQATTAVSHTPNNPSTSLPNPVSQPPKQQAPTPAPAPKHSPNLIIDIAQTSQETFPFAAVAARHNKPIQKVLDTFSAIIQLPLLKQAADGRRYGVLGSERMRLYREARRAMERDRRGREKEGREKEKEKEKERERERERERDKSSRRGEGGK
ncbi:hypothetical protein SBOR_0148 [Sclerotinia borealis F-4128]|uniref:Uncharacterized protein n=1 Tax=Sclerotinia borealis (strain F-4128) TaxID=1432307 RepID=W9CXY2_SCLBF|nr:hypothetical protein SBOR_0148 [Sclerotinia borealis F-4128]